MDRGSLVLQSNIVEAIRARGISHRDDGFLPGEAWLHRFPRRARYLSLSQLGGVSFLQELSQLGYM